MAGNDGTLKFDTKIDSSGFQEGVKGIGSITTKAMGAAATGIASLGGAAIKVGSDFEAGMSQVQAVSGASGAELEKLKEKAKEMGASTKFSATESAEALNYMAMAGWKTEDMLGGIEGIMNLAAASGEDLATTSDIVTDALTAFGMSASDSTHFADILAAASSNANTNVGMMGETFKYVAPLAGALGYSAEDTATAIGLMANAGIKGSQAGTSLRSVMTRLAKPTKDSQMAMDALGLSITDSSGKMKPLNEVIGDMRKSFAGLTEDEKANYAAMLGGQEAMSGLLAMVNTSDADFEKLSGAINNCSGSAAEMTEIMQDNLQGQLSILQSGLEVLGVSLYETMQGTAKDVVKEAQGMVQQLQDAFNEGGFEGLVGAVGDVLAQIVTRIAEAAPTLVEAAVNLVDSFCHGLIFADGLGDAGAALITSLISGLMSCAGDIWTASIVLTGRLAEGIAAGAPQMIQAAVDALADVLETLVDYMPDILQAGADIIVALAEGIAGALPMLIRQAAVIMTDIAMALVENLPAFVDAALQLVMGLVQGFAEGAPVLLEGAIELFMGILEALPVVIEQLLQALPDMITAITDYFTENTPLIVEGAVRMLMGIIEAIPAIVAAVIKNMPAIVEAIAYGMISAVPQMIEAAKVLLDSIVTEFGALPERLQGILDEVVARYMQWAEDIITKGQESAGRFVNSVDAFLSELPGKIWIWLTDVIARIQQWGSEIVAEAQESASTFVDSIIAFVSELPGKMWTWLVNTVTKIQAWGQQIVAAARMAISNAISAIISQLTQLPGKVSAELAKVTAGMKQWGADIVSQMTEVGKNIVSGIWNGISSGWDWLKGKVAELADSLLDAAKGALGINSPSTEFRDKFGRWLMPGAMEGVRRSMPTALQDMKEQAGELLEAMRRTVTASMDEITLNASAFGEGRLATSAGTVVYNDNRMEQNNDYHVAVPSPSEVAKNQREAFRNFQKGVK